MNKYYCGQGLNIEKPIHPWKAGLYQQPSAVYHNNIIYILNVNTEGLYKSNDIDIEISNQYWIPATDLGAINHLSSNIDDYQNALTPINGTEYFLIYQNNKWSKLEINDILSLIPTPNLNHSSLILDDGTNPHNTTALDVGLGNVDNTSDLNKPISVSTQIALNLKEDSVNKSVSILDIASNVKFPVWSVIVSYVSSLGYQTISNVNSLINSALNIFKTDNFLDATSSIQTQIDGKQPNGTYASGTGSANGSNTGDETTVTIQAKRPLKTVDGTSLEGVGDIPIIKTFEALADTNTYIGQAGKVATVNALEDGIEFTTPAATNDYNPNGYKIVDSYITNWTQVGRHTHDLCSPVNGGDMSIRCESPGIGSGFYIKIYFSEPTLISEIYYAPSYIANPNTVTNINQFRLDGSVSKGASGSVVGALPIILHNSSEGHASMVNYTNNDGFFHPYKVIVLNNPQVVSTLLFTPLTVSSGTRAVLQKLLFK